MPFTQGLRWRTTFSKVLLNGPPLSFKTTSLATFPRPLHAIIVPGEQGGSTLRHDPAAGVFVYGWEEEVLPDGTLKVTAPATVWAELQTLTREILTGKRGPVATIAVDGLHKLYDLFKGAFAWTPDLEDRGKTSGKMHDTFKNYLSLVLGSGVPQKVCTCFDGVEQEEGKGPKYLFPGLYGYMSKDVMGYFPVVIHTEREGVGPQTKGIWRLQAVGNVQGAGMHVPPFLIKRFPATVDVMLDRATGEVHGGWQTVEKVLAAIEDEGAVGAGAGPAATVGGVTAVSVVQA